MELLSQDSPWYCIHIWESTKSALFSTLNFFWQIGDINFAVKWVVLGSACHPHVCWEVYYNPIADKKSDQTQISKECSENISNTNVERVVVAFMLSHKIDKMTISHINIYHVNNWYWKLQFVNRFKDKLIPKLRVFQHGLTNKF